MKNTKLLILLLVAIAGALLRLYSLSGESLWNDELASRYRSSFATLTEVITSGVAPDIHPPGYQILMFYMQKFTGDSEFSLRLPSALAGILTIPLLFLLGKKLLDGATGLLAAALLAFSPVHISVSQEARPYSLLIFLTAVSVYLLYGICFRLKMGKSLTRVSSMLYISVVILLEYLHYSGLLIVAMELSILFLYSLLHKESRWKVLAICIAPVVAFLPWVPWGSAQTGTDSYIFSPSFRTVALVFFEYMSWSKFLLVLFSLLAATALISLSKGRNPGNYPASGINTILVWIFLPMIAFFIVSVIFIPVFTVRSMLFSLPAAILLLAASIRTVFPAGSLRVITSVGTCCCLLFSLLFHGYYSDPHREQFREAATYLADHPAFKTEALIAASVWNVDYFNYYFEKLSTDIEVNLRAVDLSDYPDLTKAMDSEEVDELWFLWGHLEPKQELIDSIASRYENTDYTSFLNAGVWHFYN